MVYGNKFRGGLGRKSKYFEKIAEFLSASTSRDVFLFLSCIYSYSLSNFLPFFMVNTMITVIFLTILSSFCPSVIINCAITRFMAEAEWLDGQVDVGCLGDVELVL